jgi:hypothetical protein
MCEFLPDHGVNENSGRGFYQTIRMSFSHLKFAAESDEKDSQLTGNRDTGN